MQADGWINIYASDDHLTKMRSVLSICCLPKLSSSSSTSTGSHIATLRRSLTWIKRRDLNCDLLHRRQEERLSVYWQLHVQPDSALFFSTPPLAIIWSNLQTIFNDFLEVYFTKMVTLSPNVPSDFTVHSVQFNSVDLMTSSRSSFTLIGQSSHSWQILLIWPSFKYVNIMHQLFIFSKSINQ